MPHILVRTKVEDYARWKPEFDGMEDLRKANGAREARVFRSADDPNELVILLEWDNMDNARRYTGLPELREAMERSGVLGPPDISYLDQVEHMTYE